jgi:hypothetical protein
MHRTPLLERNRALAARGLGLASRTPSANSTTRSCGPADLPRFAGLVDPAPGPGTITAFRNAGIRTVMLTGDQRLTGETIARGLGVLHR